MRRNGSSSEARPEGAVAEKPLHAVGLCELACHALLPSLDELLPELTDSRKTNEEKGGQRENR